MRFFDVLSAKIAFWEKKYVLSDCPSLYIYRQYIVLYSNLQERLTKRRIIVAHRICWKQGSSMLDVRYCEFQLGSLCNFQDDPNLQITVFAYLLYVYPSTPWFSAAVFSNEARRTLVGREEQGSQCARPRWVSPPGMVVVNLIPHSYSTPHNGLVVWNMTFMTFHILGMSSSQLTNSYFSEGLFYHQPEICFF